MGRAGEQIVIGSRDAARAQEAAKALRGRIGGNAKVEGMDNAAAAAACDIAVLTVPFSGAVPLLKQLKNAWKPGTVVIDSTVPLAAIVGGAATRMLGVWQGSAAEQTKELLPTGVSLAAAFQNLAGVQRRRKSQAGGERIGGEDSRRACRQWRKARKRPNCRITDGAADWTEHSLQGARSGDKVHRPANSLIRSVHKLCHATGAGCSS